MLTPLLCGVVYPCRCHVITVLISIRRKLVIAWLYRDGYMYMAVNLPKPEGKAPTAREVYVTIYPMCAGF